MSPKLKKGIRWVISAAILVFLILFARTIDWHAAWSSMRHASLPLLAAAIAVNLLSVVIKGVRWWLFLRPIGITSLPLALRATVAGAGWGRFGLRAGGQDALDSAVGRVTDRDGLAAGRLQPCRGVLVGLPEHPLRGA